MHKNRPIHISDCSFHSLVFTLTTEVWFCEVNLHQKKKILPMSLLIYTAWNYHSTWTFAQQKSLFSLPDLARIHLTLCKSRGLAWPQDSWCEVFPVIFSRGFTPIMLGVAHTIFINRHSVPGAGKHTASHRAEMGCFSKYSPICLILVLKGRRTGVN